LEGLLFQKTGVLTSLSEQQVLDCDNVDDHCNGGLMENVFAYVSRTGGLERESDYPYLAQQGTQCKVVPSPSYCSSCGASNFTSKSGVDLKLFKSPSRKPKSEFVPWTNITGFVPVATNNQTAFLEALAQRPLAVAIDAGALQFYDSGVIDASSCGTNLDHGVLAVGYDLGSATTTTSFIRVKNSWSSDWGESGFFRLALTANNNNASSSSSSSSEPSSGTCGIYSDVTYPFY